MSAFEIESFCFIHNMKRDVAAWAIGISLSLFPSQLPEFLCSANESVEQYFQKLSRITFQFYNRTVEKQALEYLFIFCSQFIEL